MKLFTTKQSSVVFFTLTILIFFATSNTGYGQAINPPLSERTPQIRDAIVAAVPGVNAAADVTAAHLAAISRLDASKKSITALKNGDFSGLTALTNLYLYENAISDISTLEDLTKLTNLYLYENAISDISTLEDLTKLTHLSLGENAISDISTLENLTKLTRLELYNNSISDISALEDLTSLTHLWLFGNAISDISTLENLTSLRDLWLTGNAISNISALEDLTSLTHLSLGENAISDISTLENLTSLRDLSLAGNAISNISALEDLTSLSYLSLTGNAISDTSPLENLTKLKTLLLYGNPISDYGPVRRLRAAVQAAGSGIYIDVNIDNNPPVFTDGSSTTRAVAENTASGTDIGTAVAATDANSGDTLTYTLSGTDASSFNIVSTSGQLQTSAALDYESKSSYSVTVSVSDGNGGSDAIDVTINVTDVNEIDPPLSDRTQQVRSAIVAAISDVDNADDVTGAHLAKITELDLSGITSLKSGDFNGLTALTTLHLWFNSITDISPLEGLTTLTELHLNDNSITDISPLEGLTNLTTLYLNDNSITDISPLEGLTNLTNLNLDGNSIKDISPLEDLTNLTNLNLDGNSIKDISPLEDLTKLIHLDLRNNSISDVSALEDLTKLIHLDLRNNSISDVSALEDLTKLIRLDLRNNSISDVSALEDLTELTTLYLNNNSIINVSALENLTSLQELLLRGNPISDYGPLRKLKAANPDISIGININNNPPVFTDGDSVTRSVAENTAAGTNIGAAVSAIDADNHTLTYSLGGTDAESFDIVSDSGQLQTKDDLDYETKASYTVTVTAYDGNSGGDRITVTIDVTDVDENVGAAPSVETSSIIPENTALLTNFPNPFNPETWIPYQLAKPAEVTLTIYDIRGVVVRELKLGHQAAGVYHSRSRAIHWDGRNNIGEQVATGVYFYTFKAGDFSATRKLLIRK